MMNSEIYEEVLGDPAVQELAGRVARKIIDALSDDVSRLQQMRAQIQNDIAQAQLELHRVKEEIRVKLQRQLNSLNEGGNTP